jgi:chorismate mutase
MIHTTVHLTVSGDSYEEILSKSRDLLDSFFQGEAVGSTPIEIVIFEAQDDMDSEFAYTANITAKVRQID